MESKETILQTLGELAEKDKFSIKEWNDRGLHPSEDDVINYMNTRLDLVIAELVLAIENNASKRKLKRILKAGLSRYNRIDLDTEEAEFIVDYFDLLSYTIGIRFGDNLMRWLYGISLFWLMKITRIFKPERIINIKKYLCTKCSAELEIQLKKKGSNSKSEWIIGKCLTCNEFNLMDTFADAKLTTFKNFYPQEHLSKDEFTEEQASIRLEQVKYWRK